MGLKSTVRTTRLTRALTTPSCEGNLCILVVRATSSHGQAHASLVAL
jgi:hypothetical protein